MDYSTRPDRRVLGVAGNTCQPDHRRSGPACPGMQLARRQARSIDIIARDDTDSENPGLSSSRFALAGRQRSARVGRCLQSCLAARVIGRVVSTTRPAVRIDVVALDPDAQALRHWPCRDVH